MKTNVPYKKQLNDEGQVINECPSQKEPNRRQRRLVGKYIILTNPRTGEFVGKVKTNGNNRAHNRKGKRTING